MRAYYELRKYTGGERVWIGEYENLRNLSHWHYDCELIYVKRGSAEVHVNRESFLLGEGDAMFIGSGDVHRIEAKSDSLLTLLLFDDSIISDLQGDRQLKCPRLLGEYGLPSVLGHISHELKDRRPLYNKAAENLIENLVIEMLRTEELDEKKREDSYSSRYKLLLGEIEENYVWYSFSDAASFMGISEHYFSGLFHKMSGITFSAYLNTVKVRHAIELLKESSEKSITEISIECGFNSIRHFNRVFKEITGYSPKSLPEGFSLLTLPVKDIKRITDPTLEGSRLLTENKI